MAYSRPPGPYMYPSTHYEKIICCACSFPQLDPLFTSRTAAIEHLQRHRRLEGSVVSHAIRRLQKEREEYGDTYRQGELLL